MTFVAGALTPDGALLAADCRLTVSYGRRPSFPVDDAQKIIPLGNRTAIGFAGDLQTASFLFGQILGPHGQGRRMDGVSIRRWLPRLLKAAYAALKRTTDVRDCALVVASSVAGRTQRVNMKDVARLLRRTEGWSNYLLMRVWPHLPDRSGFVEVPHSSYGLVYWMEAPEFQPRDVRPLDYCAIGSGADDVRKAMRLYAPHIFNDHPGQAAGWFMEAMAHTLAGSSIDTVGGMFITTVLTNGKMATLLTQNTDGTGLGAELIIENGRFVQVDAISGLRIRLRPPGEIHRNPPIQPKPFPHYSKFWPASPSLDEPRYPHFATREFIENLKSRRAEHETERRRQFGLNPMEP